MAKGKNRINIGELVRQFSNACYEVQNKKPEDEPIHSWFFNSGMATLNSKIPLLHNTKIQLFFEENYIPISFDLRSLTSKQKNFSSYALKLHVEYGIRLPLEEQEEVKKLLSQTNKELRRKNQSAKKPDMITFQETEDENRNLTGILYLYRPEERKKLRLPLQVTQTHVNAFTKNKLDSIVNFYSGIDQILARFDENEIKDMIKKRSKLFFNLAEEYEEVLKLSYSRCKTQYLLYLINKIKEDPKGLEYIKENLRLVELRKLKLVRGDKLTRKAHELYEARLL